MKITKPEKRIKRFRIYLQLIPYFFQEDTIITVEQNGIPSGFKVLNTIPVPDYDSVDIVIEHESFPIVKEGEIIPLAGPTVFNSQKIDNKVKFREFL